MSSSLQWIDALVEEKIARKMGLKWTVETIKVNEIDRELSLKNMGRLDKPLHHDLVQDYQNAMLSGSAFPRIFVHKAKSGKYIISSGNHRYNAAADLGEKEIEVYVFKNGTEQELDLFARTVNGTNGFGYTRDERIQQAIAEMEIYGMNLREAAKQNNLKEHTLSDALRAKECCNEMIRMGIANAEKLKQGHFLRLSALKDNENVFRLAGGLVATFAMPVEEVGELVKQIKKAKTEAQQIGVVGEWEAKCKNEKVKRVAGGGVPLRTRTKILRCLHTLFSLIEENPTASRCQFETEDKEDLRPEYLRCTARLDKILGVKR